MDLHVIATIAAHELRVNMRHRWIVVFACAFAALALAIAYFGMTASEVIGFQGFTRTTASFLNLVLYIVPLVALTMSALSFTPERGSAEMLFAQPVTRTEVLLGKIAGLFVSLACALLFAFGVSGLVIGAQAGTEGALRYTAFVLLMLLLALIFICAGALAAITADSRNRTFVVVVAIWCFFVIVYDLLVIAAVMLLKHHTANLLLFASLFGNPIDLARVAGLMSLGTATIFGPAGSALLKFMGGPKLTATLLVASLVLWSALQAAVSAFVFRRRDI